MNIFRYKQVRDYDVEQYFRKHLDLTVYQKQRIEDVIRSAPFDFISFEKEAAVFWPWRLTVIFFILFILLLWITMPIKWMLTGHGRYGQKSIALKVYRFWGKRIGWNH